MENLEPSLPGGGGVENGLAILEKNLAHPQKVRHRVTILTSNTFLGIYPREMKTCARKHTQKLYITVYGSISRNSQK